MSDPAKIMQGDALIRLRDDVAIESIHCVVTSPPYDNLRSYAGNCDWNFEGIAAELYRVLTPGGVVCWNVGDSVVNGSETLTSFRQAIHFVDRVGFRMHDTMIWQKSNFSNPEKARYHQLFEYVFILSKGKPRVFNPICDKLNKYSSPLGKNTFRKTDGERAERAITKGREFGMRGNVWLGNTRGQEIVCAECKHPAMMPKWLAKDLVLSWTNSGDVVCDPFAGSGTTGEAAISNGRRFVGIELNADYIPLIVNSCRQQGLAL